MEHDKTLQTIKPIILDAEQVKSILDGRKTQIRRSVKGEIPNDAEWGYTMFTPKHRISCRGYYGDNYVEAFFKMPFEKGDSLYVRETWAPVLDYVDGQPVQLYIYKADGKDFYQGSYVKIPVTGWHPSTTMPKDAARLFLKITSVKVERLQEIDEDGAMDEGVMPEPPFSISPYTRGFSIFWDKTIKKSNLDKCGWNANPWVWVYEFERINNVCFVKK